MRKVLRVVISTNRINYLAQTFESCKKIDFSGLDVHHLLIDDFPKGRNDEMFSSFVLLNGFDEVILNDKNKGITKQWEKIFELAKDYDYVFMHEDDVLVQREFKLEHLIILLERDSSLSQVQLKRNNWYEFEKEEIKSKESDWTIGDFRYERHCDYFWGLMSVWPTWITKEPIEKISGHKLSESTIAWYMKNYHNKWTAQLKTEHGGIMVEHIGEITKGFRTEKGVPGFIEGVSDKRDPSIERMSRNINVTLEKPKEGMI
jgi:hypothetical protein